MRLALDEAWRARRQARCRSGPSRSLAARSSGRGFNRPIGAVIPTAHAEIVALREAAAKVETTDWWAPTCTSRWSRA